VTRSSGPGARPFGRVSCWACRSVAGFPINTSWPPGRAGPDPSSAEDIGREVRRGAHPARRWRNPAFAQTRPNLRELPRQKPPEERPTLTFVKKSPPRPTPAQPEP